MKLVVCDDDVTLRGVVTKLATDAGHQVLAETDSAADATDMILRFGAEALILDLALPWGTGLRVVRELREAGSPCQIVVFTSYAADSPEVRDAGVRAVIEKPDFDALEEVLSELAAGKTADTPVGAERRRPPAPRTEMPPAGQLSVSGLEPNVTFADAVNAMEPSDAVLVIKVAGVEQGAGWFARAAGLDHLLAVARCLRAVLRVQDRITLAEHDVDGRYSELHALLVGGGRPGIESVFRRLEKAHAAQQLPGVVSGGWAHAEPGMAGGMVLARAIDAANRSVGRPEGDRLWAG